MNKEESFKILSSRRFQLWNDYRQKHPGWVPDLSGLDLSKMNFVFANPLPDLSRAVLYGCKMPSQPHLYLNIVKTKAKLDGALFDTSTESEMDLTFFGAVFMTEAEKLQANTAKQKSVFISYAWANQGVIAAIDQWLRLKGLEVRIDSRDFFAGARLRDEIMRLMKDSEVVLIFHSNESKDKPWTKFEKELAADLEMAAATEGKPPPRIIYVVIDDTPLPSVTESNKLAIKAKGKRFELVCEEIYHHILQLPRSSEVVDMSKWQDYVF